jgi:hypothetical protein
VQWVKTKAVERFEATSREFGFAHSELDVAVKV